ncbi:unnamed protein product [Paramecium sonneborni]|uniref:EGF-like domain-containing protein n=1 Tax=Paramecium sonneborni TaxID=65129 RepID=A0A8S1LRN2_9CILI|nr:unnamed protein product [Paramecium sonneborni]
MDLEMFYHIFDKKFIFSIQGNFTQPNAGWILRLFSLTSGYCPANCILCNQRFKCQTCANGFFKLADATCQWGCPQERINNGYNCIQYDQVTKYSKFLIREFYDLTVKDTLNATFILESSSTIDFQKGSDIFWSYLTNKIIFGGKFVWAQSRFSQIYTLDPHHSLTIYFQVIFGPNFPNSISNYLSYEINNGTINKITKTSSLNIVEQILTYNPTLTIAIQCYGINVIDSYCGISNYYIVVHYCKPYCYRCSNELTCDQWMPYDPNIIKVEQSQCQSNQFLDETTSTCEYCPNECLTCFNEYECLTCKSNYKLVITTCILDCQLNQYYDGVNCLDCNYSCRQCQSINYCIHCESTSLRYLQDGQCLCYDGYYDQINIQQCQPCDKLCAKCNGPTNKNCQSCIILNNLIKTGNTCECSIGYYFDEFKLKCLKCSDKCETCFNFSNTSCLSCYSIQFRIIDGLNCKCQNGYYDDNSDICIQCPFLEDSLLQQCYKICGDNSIIWFNSNCPFVICGNGYNNVNNQCLPICGDLIIVAEEDCDDGNSIQFDGCHNCRFQCPAQCTTCNSITQFPCSDVCGDGIVSGLEECDDSHPIQLDSCYQCKFQCQPQCTRCNRGVCQNCLNFGWVLEPYTRRCIETCGDSYQVGNEQCEEMNTRMLDGCYNCQQSCQKSCLTCTINGCNQCEVGYQLINRYCRNICGDSLVVDGEDCDDGNLYPFDTCHQCVYQCQSECLNCQQGSCLFCIDGFIAFDGECVEIQKIPIIPSNEYYQHDLIEFCKIKVNGICYECQKNYKLNNLYNTCELEERKEIIKIESFEVLPQFIQYCQFQLNNLCIICYKNFGLDIFTNLCEPICGDGILTGIEECEDNNHQILDGCYECMHQCNEYCEICEFGKCILCHLNTIYVPAIFQCEILQQCTQPGSYYNEEINKCYSICGDGFIYQKEQCDDGNDIKFDGCHNCQYSCAPGYTVINGECIKEQIDCKEGLYYSFTSLSCKPQCGDGVVIQPYEECDDGNEVINDECHSCKLQCSIHCQECSIQNLCLKCKEGYELIDFKCENLNNSLCYTNNCKLCENYECFTCINGYYLYDNECIPECGDGILANLEECDDGNLINGDGCDDNCIISENALCRNNECAVLRYPQPILEFDKEILGVQYVNLRYSSKMRLLDGVTQKEYLDNLFFEIQDQPEIALFQIIVKQKITMQLQFIDIQVSVKFLEFVKNPFIQLKFLEKNNLVDEYGAGILEDSIKIKLRSSNVLDIQSQKISDSLTGINDYMMKFLIILMIIATISGQSEIISNLLDIIQQLYYLKYINSRIGVNLEKFFDIFAIIQLNDIFDLLNDQTNLFSFYHSEPIFETDDRNANYLVNIVSLLQVYFNYISHSFCQKLSLLVISERKIILLFVRELQIFCFRIQKKRITESIKDIFFALIYEFGINTFLALKYQRSDFEGQLGVSLAITIFYVVIMILLIKQTHFNIPIIKKIQLSQLESNNFTYQCTQKILFVLFLIFFFESSEIQILLSMMNQFQFTYFIYRQKYKMITLDFIKMIISNSVLLLIFVMYLVNDFYQDEIENLMIIGWIIISFMSTIIFITFLVDLIKVLHPIWQRCQIKFQTQKQNENFYIVENPQIIEQRFKI